MSTETFAAVDLGSNSFHMIVASYADGRLQVIDRLKDMVRLASGLDEERMLRPEAMDRALKCLERFGERVREIPRGNVRAVGTNTLRQARNRRAFLARARQALGHPIEIISGHEEARLIYLGVARTVYDENTQRLVVDIGGGSTELIIGVGLKPLRVESLYMGCVSTSERFFGDGEINERRMRRAMLFARQELAAVERVFRRTGWQAAIGASGTIRAISESIRERKWSDNGITPDALAALREYLVSAGNAARIDLAAVSERRRPVFPGGVAILSAVFEALGIERMTISDGALREGLLHDLIGRVEDQDTRDRTILDFAQRFGVDQGQAQRVQSTAMELFDQVRGAWNLNAPDDPKLLSWAAQLHELGLAVAHAQHHRHAAYLLAHSDMPGFSREDQVNVATLVRLHRRRLALDELERVPESDRPRILHLCILLRLAVLLNRSRSEAPLPEIKATAGAARMELVFPENWLGDHPLTLTDLETEKEMLAAAGFELGFS